MIKQVQRKRSWALTGTPLENEVDDLASIMEFVDQGELVSTMHYQSGTELIKRHQELQLRRKKIDVLDQLPPKRISKIADAICYSTDAKGVVRILGENYRPIPLAL